MNINKEYMEESLKEVCEILKEARRTYNQTLVGNPAWAALPIMVQELFRAKLKEKKVEKYNRKKIRKLIK